jgi:hypothetical protein
LGTFWLKIKQFWPFEEILFLVMVAIKIEISSNGQNCSILSQNVSKFELYKRNDELFNIYYRIAKWFLTRRFLKMIFCLFMPNLHNWSKSAKVQNS